MVWVEKGEEQLTTGTGQSRHFKKAVHFSAQP